MKETIRKAIIAFAWFLAFCAVLAFFGGILAYMLSDGASPQARGDASDLLVQSWGSAYLAVIMALAALLTITGMVSKKLPGLGGPSAERAGTTS